MTSDKFEPHHPCARPSVCQGPCSVDPPLFLWRGWTRNPSPLNTALYCVHREANVPSYGAAYGERYSDCWPYVWTGLSSVRVDSTSPADAAGSPGWRRSWLRPTSASASRESCLGPRPPPCRMMSDPVPPVWAGMQLLFAATTPNSSLNSYYSEVGQRGRCINIKGIHPPTGA